MKKTLLKIGAIIACTLVFTYSCQDDENFAIEPDNESFSVEEARSWFEANNSPILMMNREQDVSYKLQNNGKSNKPVLLQPDWTHAFTSTRGHLETVELHLKSRGQFRQVLESSYQKWKETDNLDYTISMSRLVILKNRKTDMVGTFIMSVVPEADYLESKNFKLWKNSYFSKDHNFSGNIVFHNPLGKFINGWGMENGKVTSELTHVPDIVMYDMEIINDCTYSATTTLYSQETEHWILGELGNPDRQGESTWEFWTETEFALVSCPLREDSDPPPYVEEESPDYGGADPESPLPPPSLLKPHCSSFEYANNGGFKAAAVAGLRNTFYTYALTSGGILLRSAPAYIAVTYFTMPSYMTNGRAATLTALAVDRAFEATEDWYASNPQALEVEVKAHMWAGLKSEMGLIGGGISTTYSPFTISNPAPFIQDFNTGNCN